MDFMFTYSTVLHCTLLSMKPMSNSLYKLKYPPLSFLTCYPQHSSPSSFFLPPSPYYSR